MKTTHFIVEGCTWGGRTVLVNGKPIQCAHKHRSAASAKACIARTRRANACTCDTYRVVEVTSTPFLTTGMRSVIKKYHEIS